MTGRPDDLLTLPQVAERLGRPPSTLRYMRQQGTGPRSAIIAGRVMYKRADLEAWIDQQFQQDRLGQGHATSA